MRGRLATIVGFLLIGSLAYRASAINQAITVTGSPNFSSSGGVYTARWEDDWWGGGYSDDEYVTLYVTVYWINSTTPPASTTIKEIYTRYVGWDLYGGTDPDDDDLAGVSSLYAISNPFGDSPTYDDAGGDYFPDYQDWTLNVGFDGQGGTHYTSVPLTSATGTVPGTSETYYGIGTLTRSFHFSATLTNVPTDEYRDSDDLYDWVIYQPITQA